MKKALLLVPIIFIIIYSCSSVKPVNDWTRYGYKGKVKKIIVREYIHNFFDGKIRDTLYGAVNTIIYNSDGNIVKYSHQLGYGEYDIRKYNKKGFLTEIKNYWIYKNDTTLHSIEKMKYNKAGKILQKIEYNGENGRPMDTTDYLYNKKGKLIYETTHDLENTTYIYNKEGILELEIMRFLDAHQFDFYDKDGEITKDSCVWSKNTIVRTYEYLERDSLGNITLEIERRNDMGAITRYVSTYEYY